MWRIAMLTAHHPSLVNLGTLTLFSARLLSAAPPKVDFARDIQPLFQKHWLECHGPSQ